jgi:hypothetical protein
MILEGIVTTIGLKGEINVAPMGPRADDTMQRFVLRPYQTATTYRNLKYHGEGVLHVTDDVWLLAQAAIGPVDPPPEMFPAATVRGQVLAGTCRWYEFRVTRLDDREERTTIECEVVHTGRLRDFFGFNRAKHAVVEAAILATRTDFLPITEIRSEFERLAVLVRKTGGDAEHRAFEFLSDHIQRVAERMRHTEVRHE